VEVAHYGAEPMEDGKGVWRIDDRLVGEWDARDDSDRKEL
jgi:hypothetical protein